MIITKKTIAEKILEYLHHNITLAQLVDWSENNLMDGEFEDKNFELIKDILSKLALADVRAFGLMWEDCEAYLKNLGYKVNVNAEAI